MLQICVEHSGNSDCKMLGKELKSRKTAKGDWKYRRKAATASLIGTAVRFWNENEDAVTGPLLYIIHFPVYKV